MSSIRSGRFVLRKDIPRRQENRMEGRNPCHLVYSKIQYASHEGTCIATKGLTSDVCAISSSSAYNVAGATRGDSPPSRIRPIFQSDYIRDWIGGRRCRNGKQVLARDSKLRKIPN